MLTFVSIVHVLLCVFMIFVILLQPGKDAGMGAALGGGAATSAFGGRGAVTFLSKVTAVCATGFFLTALGLSFVGMRTSVGASVAPEPPPASAPATPGTAAPATAAPAAQDTSTPGPQGCEPAAEPAPAGTQPPAEQPAAPAGQSGETPKNP